MLTAELTLSDNVTLHGHKNCMHMYSMCRDMQRASIYVHDDLGKSHTAMHTSLPRDHTSKQLAKRLITFDSNITFSQECVGKTELLEFLPFPGGLCLVEELKSSYCTIK